jgi:hypothetical protein
MYRGHITPVSDSSGPIIEETGIKGTGIVDVQVSGERRMNGRIRVFITMLCNLLRDDLQVTTDLSNKGIC